MGVWAWGLGSGADGSSAPLPDVSASQQPFLRLSESQALVQEFAKSLSWKAAAFGRHKTGDLAFGFRIFRDDGKRPLKTARSEWRYSAR